MRDRTLILGASALRATAIGITGAALAAYLRDLGHGPAAVGLVTSAGLAGGAAAALVVTLAGDRIGRRRSLVALAALGAVAGSAALVAMPLAALVAVSFLASWNGMGRDRGPALVLEQAMLPATATDAGRTTAFARYHALQDAGNALGFLLVGAWLASHLRLALAAYPALCLVSLVLYARLSPSVEAPARAGQRVPVSPEGRRVIARISALTALDGLGGGFLTSALVAYFFFDRFGASVSTVAILYFAARILNAASHLAAARLARRFGLVNTMVFTHIPSSLLLATVAIAPSFPVAAALFLLRESLVEMDVPTRQSYVMAVVRPEDRTVASGTTNLVRVASWAVAPAIAGPLMESVALATPLFVAAALKIAYDLLLWGSFRRLPPPEER